MNERGIEEVITTLYEMIQEARSLPLSGDKGRCEDYLRLRIHGSALCALSAFQVRRGAVRP